MENSTDGLNVTLESNTHDNDDVRIQATSFLMYKIGKFYIGKNLHHSRQLRYLVCTNYQNED